MPSRILREGILSSERVNALTAAAEVFYRRLMSVVDDYGRFDGRPAMLRVSCYPLRVDSVREADISRSIAECVTAGLIALYEVDGKPYLEMQDFKQQVRAKSKYPSPDDGQLIADCAAVEKQLQSKRSAGVHLVGGVSGDGGEFRLEPNGSVGKADALPPAQVQALVDLYHSVLPEMPQVRLMPDKRRKALTGFWKWILTSKKPDGDRRATTAAEALEWAKSYFERVRDNDFLMGRAPKKPGHENWLCDLEFLLSDKGMSHVIEKTREAA